MEPYDGAAYVGIDIAGDAYDIAGAEYDGIDIVGAAYDIAGAAYAGIDIVGAAYDIAGAPYDIVGADNEPYVGAYPANGVVAIDIVPNIASD
jgi:hypothetical protein